MVLVMEHVLPFIGINLHLAHAPGHGGVLPEHILPQEHHQVLGIADL